MNGTEQRRQATVAQKLDQTAENLAVLFDALDARVFDLATKAQETRREVNELRAAHALSVRDLHDRLSVQHANLAAIAAEQRSDGARVNRLVEAVDTLRSDNLKTHDEILLLVSRDRSYVVREISESNTRLSQFQTRAFWQRLVWLFTGR